MCVSVFVCVSVCVCVLCCKRFSEPVIRDELGAKVTNQKKVPEPVDRMRSARVEHTSGEQLTDTLMMNL